MKLENQKIATSLVYLSGIVTSIIALVLVYFILFFFEFSLLGFYVWFLPIGSLLVGLGAGSGYFVTSRLLNVKTKSFFTVVTALSAILFYTAAYYILYVYLRKTTSIDGFIRYMFVTASSSSLTIGKSMRSTIDNVGIFGYVLLGLEYIGFILGSVLPVTYGKDKPYCNDCKLFYKEEGGSYYIPNLDHTDIANPQSPESKILVEKNNEILRAENQTIQTAIRAKSYEDKMKYLEQLREQSVSRSTFFLNFAIQKCPKCGNHIITSTLNSCVNKEGAMSTEDLGVISISPAPAQ